MSSSTASSSSSSSRGNSSSSSSSSCWLDKIYLVYFIIHIPILFCVDLVPLYPPSLWVPDSSPLHFLSDLRSYYLENYKDQFFHPTNPIPSFFPLFALLELVFHLPVSVWAVGKLKGRGGEGGGKGKGLLAGKDELLLLVYGIETALTTATCMYEAYLWDEEVVSWEEKKVLLGGLYGGYFALAAVLTVDMYVRLLRRVTVVVDGEGAVKKVQ